MTDNREVAIQIEGLKKRYKLGTIGGGTLVGDLQSWWAKVRHKEDPNSKIGAKTYGKNETFMALDGIDLTVYKGERLGIIGHNGAGKSTLLKLLSRVTGPTEGEIGINGRISSMLEVGTGFNGELTGRENVYINGAILGMSKAEVDAKMDQIIEFSECAQFIDTPVKRYSSGMYVKLAFAVAAHLDSEILVMDEVLAVGDTKFQQKCLGKMGDVSSEEGRTVLYVSHNMSTIRQLCDRCIVLDHGKIIFNGEVEKAIDIYVQVKKITQENCINLADIERPKYIQNVNRAKMTELSLLNRKEYFFNKNEEVPFLLKWDCRETIKNQGIRIEFSRIDGTGIATSFLENVCDVDANSQNKVQFSINCKYFAPGKYSATIVLFHKNEYTGRSDDDDNIINAFTFEIKEDNFYVWNHRAWGSIQLDCLKGIHVENEI